jgi:hypothetical protein
VIGVPKFYANVVNVAPGPYDVTLTFIEFDPTRLPELIEGQHEPSTKAVLQVVMSLGHAKSFIPLIAKAIADYEDRFGPIPAPGFDQLSKE